MKRVQAARRALSTTVNWRALSLILLLALALRLVNLNGRALWYDEAFSVLFAEKGLAAMLDGTLTQVDGAAAEEHPLLYYVALDGWMAAFGQSAFTVRLWSVLTGVLTVAAVYLVARELFAEKTGHVAALITALAPFHVQYSQEARMYSLMAFLLALATLAFLRGQRALDEAAASTPPQPLPVHGEGLAAASASGPLPLSPQAGKGGRGDRGRRAGAAPLRTWLWWPAFGLLAGLAMYTQQLAAFYLAALGLVPVLTRRRDLLARVAFGTAVAVVVYLPWLVHLPSQLGKVRAAFWLTPPNAARFILTARSFLLVNLDVPPPFAAPAFFGALMIALFLVVQLVFFFRRRRARGAEQRAVVFAVWLAAAPPALMWLVSQWQPVYLERALLPSALMLYVTLAWLFTRAGIPRPILGAIGALYVALAGVGLYHHYTWDTFPNSPFAEAAGYIEADWQDGDVVVHHNKLTALPMMLYARDLPQRFLGDAPGAPEDTLALPTQRALQVFADDCIQATSAGAARVWFVAFAFAEAQYAAAGRPEFRQARDWLQTHYAPAQSRRFNDLLVQRYEKVDGAALSTACEARDAG